MTSFLIQGAKGILTGRQGTEARAYGDIRVADGKITEIGSLRAGPGERVVDAGGCVVTPGLVNTHHHLFQSVLKAVPEGMNEGLAKWLRLVPYSYWQFLDEEALRVSATIGMAELALSGTTTVADHHYIYSASYDYDPNEILFDTADKFGMRFVLERGGATKGRVFDDSRSLPLPTETLDAMLQSVEATAKQWHDPSDDAMRRVIFAPTTPTFSLQTNELEDAIKAVRGLGLRIHSHLSENMDYVNYTLQQFDKKPIHWLADHDWLGEDVFFAHLVECDPSEVALLAATGTGMAHCPQANARLGSGIAPAAALSDLGGNVSLAVDGAAANEAADMVSALYSAFTVHRAAGGAEAVDAETLIHWATAGGARVLGLPGIGTIEVGKSADLVLFDLAHPRYLGQHDALIGPVISGGAADVRHSFVQGRPVVENGALPWLDMEQLAADAARVTDRIISQSQELARAV
ncbi:amidohydrolase family protein [Qingshengfaniella alkalisoli]|uniref:Amidohydrolase family protein n=1 Tax=Qingshengfaniella alkalisoli TaxID=2599296 RepID=A0A5B8J9C3_9RHOB|nr:amidohydrolase family protein [Qingshengfaniella alkalisoli]QDY70850.1 amidohydrolase family protein [Qingshengfaniella alkalisoli]